MEAIYISTSRGDLTAECSQPIELSPFCHSHTKKHNFQVIK